LLFVNQNSRKLIHKGKNQPKKLVLWFGHYKHYSPRYSQPQVTKKQTESCERAVLFQQKGFSKIKCGVIAYDDKDGTNFQNLQSLRFWFEELMRRAGVNFTNILSTALALRFWRQKCINLKS
jgi:hypothetical protein